MSELDRERVCVGVLSGTSADAIEVAVCRIRGSGATASLTLLAHHSQPLPPDVSARIHDERLTPVGLAELDFELGERFAAAVLDAILIAKVRTADVAAIGSHGQTIAHVPPGTRSANGDAATGALPHPASTLQLGSAAVIAERTGRPVVHDFRSRDIAAGGHGAPLVPYLDWAIFRGAGRRRIFQNLGGIGNVSVVGDRLEDTIAFDTGPANMILDALTRRATGGLQPFDRNGALASSGTVIAALLEELLAHPFLAKPPPRSAGRELFGDVLVDELWRRFPDRATDLLATAVALTVESTARAYEQFVLPRLSPGELEGVYLSGGGVRNPLIFRGLRDRLSPLPVSSLDALGFPEVAKEAALFALLASEHLEGRPANVPPATGARRPVVLGSLFP